ncbi:hypothetical protein T440DRAFT_542492 [Plenodomus tracheiphilus IPT5]|uniref:Uncharacterized protein n=1 Tax=Plenodomus tracheiphilus IPT5 TaxID=1408161 RepID=A0A6A7BK92_9PLEO|nr:hypothetical protein T440DRAFT_542492 [Plenodomus tracheiphilus IPT5]
MDPSCDQLSPRTRGRPPKKWPPIFSESRKSPNDSPWVDLLRAYDPLYDGVQLFMQQYVGDAASLHVTNVIHFCRNVRPRDFNGQMKLKGTGWLDERPVPCLTALGDHIEHMSILQQPSGSTPPVARGQSENLRARELHGLLRRKRFDNEDYEDADRRLVYIANPDPYDIQALTETTAYHQAFAVQELLWKYLARQTALNVKIPSKGWRIFQMELHLFYHTLRGGEHHDFHGTYNDVGQSTHWDLSFLGPEDEECNWRMEEAQFSLVICGSDNARWAAYSLDHTGSDIDRERGVDEQLPYRRSDPIAMGSIDADKPIGDAREYFLTIVFIRMQNYCNETRDLVEAFKRSYTQRLGVGLSNSAPGSHGAVTPIWVESMLHHLSMLAPNVARTNATWLRFASGGRDIDYFTDHSTLSSQTKEYMQGILDAMDTITDDLETFEIDLRRLQDECKELRERLGFRMSSQGSRISQFTMMYISPVLVVASVFAIPDQITFFKRNTLSFILSIGVVMMLLYSLLSFKVAQRCHNWWARAATWAQNVWLRHGVLIAREGSESPIGV